MLRRSHFERFTAALALLALGSGCTVGPRYQRPELPAPAQHRGLEGAASSESIADLPWWLVFEDVELQALVRESIAGNLDLRVAAARVVESRARAGIAASFLYPEVGFGTSYGGGQLSRRSDPPQAGASDRTVENWNAGFQLSWELDLFGRIRREKEAAVATYLATEEARRGVLVTLVADVASTYFLLSELDLELDIARRTLALNDETVAFYEKRLTGGISNKLEVDQARGNRSATAAVIPDIERQVVLSENFLCLLLGRPPGPIARGAALAGQYTLPPHVPAGLPATLLERRPDVVRAERLLMAANADVGAAKALFFPTISLTGFLGGASRELEDLTRSDAGVWSLSAGLLQPIFQAGRIRRNYEATQARFDQAFAQYQKSALDAYRDVADSLATIQKLAEIRAEQEKGVEALADAARLSRSRYDTGLSNYLEILIADQQLFQVELQLAQTRGSQLRALAQLYRALGGGWQPEAAENEEGAGTESASQAEPG